MGSDFRKAIFSVVPILALVFVCAQSLRSQERCLTRDDVKKMLAQIESHVVASPNEKLREELLSLREKEVKRIRDAVTENKKDDALLKGMNDSRGEKHPSVLSDPKRVWLADHRHGWQRRSGSRLRITQEQLLVWVTA